MPAPTLDSNVLNSIAKTAEYVQEKWTRDIQKPFDTKLQIAPLVQDRSGLISDGGDTIHVPFTAGIDARAKAAATNITYDSPEGTPVTISIDKHYYVGVMIEDLAKVQSNYDLKSAFQDRMSEALARQIDTDLMGLYSVAGQTVSAGSAVGDASVLELVTKFDSSDTPQSGRRGVIGHNTKADLLGVNKYTTYDQTGKNGKAVDGSDGLVGTVYGIDFYHSGNVPVATTGRNLFFHRSAITKAVQLKPKFEMEYSVDALGFKTALHTVYGIGVERPQSVIELTRQTAA